MNSYGFTVDNDLVIRSVNISLSDKGAVFAEGLVGQPYSRFFPIFLNDGRDAVETVMSEGTPLLIKDHEGICLCGYVRSNIIITPLKGKNGSISGAEVIREASSECFASVSGRRDRQLIDIGRNSAALAHGVRNPLNAIKGAVVYLKERFDREPTIVEFAGIIEEEISRLDSFISRFLSTSMLESESATLDINELIRRILTMSTYQGYAKNISFVTELGDVPLLKADAFQLEHALMNVINNALEAMNEGGTIHLSTERIQRDSRDFVTINISDSGVGMFGEGSDDMAAFSDGHRREGGRGFGLFLTREIVQHHGGLLEIVSRKNIGTSIKIFLPVAPI